MIKTHAIGKQTDTSSNYSSKLWKPLLSEYLPHLTNRLKLETNGPLINLGGLLVFKEGSAPRIKWPLPRIIEM